MIRVTTERVMDRFVATAADAATPFLRITSCPHLHCSARSARRCFTATRRRAERMLRRQVKRA
jgi:hypothetical protein